VNGRALNALKIQPLGRNENTHDYSYPSGHGKVLFNEHFFHRFLLLLTAKDNSTDNSGDI
jgi:hypothetical protein